MKRLALAGLLCLMVAPSSAQAARFSVGLQKGADVNRVAGRVESATGHPVTKIGSFALSVQAREAGQISAVRGVSWVERDRASRRLAFSPNDPLAVRQWYLGRIHAFDAWPQVPTLQPVRVAVLDSGVDSSHPELQNQIVDGQSFVSSSSWESDTNGHGTFVAGEIAAALNNNQGIAGVGFSVDLLIAKIVRSDGTISPDAEARAIHWAVARGARVINMSFGGVRDPRDPSQDTYSQVEAAAVQYAVSKGVLVVAAVGNADGAPTEPWGYAGYPAALPHVLGVSAITDTGGVPSFSNRDRIYNDVAAPGLRILSILPRPLTARYPSCSEQGYSSCGPDEYREAEGTSFAAPQVSAAAAVLLSLHPTLRPEQVTEILESTAIDVTADTCSACADGRDAYSGWGRLDVASAIGALAKHVPAPDSYEANDDLGQRAYPLSGTNRRVHAAVDFWDDQDDVYTIQLKANQPVYVGLTGWDPSVDLSLAFWLPQAKSI